MLPPRSILPRALLFALVGCSADPGQGPGSSATTHAASSASASAAASSLEPAWEAARVSGDPLDIASLARTVRAPALLLQIDDASYGEVARAALVEARDAEVALAPLAERVRKGGAAAERDAELMLAIVSREPSYGEALDPDGLTAALGDLEAVMRDANRERRLRGLCGSIARRLAEGGAKLSQPIPTDLDGE